MQGQIDVNFLVNKYEEEVGKMSNKIIYLEAYIEQLERQIIELSKEEESEDKK